MSTSRRRLGGIPGRRSLGGTVSSRRMWPKYGLARSTEPLMLRPRWPAERRQVVHLLEERRQVLRLGHGHVVAQLEHALLVERPAPRRRHVGPGARVERAAAPWPGASAPRGRRAYPSASSSRPGTDVAGSGADLGSG